MIYSWQLVAGLLLVDAVEMDMWCLVLCRQDHVCIIHRRVSTMDLPFFYTQMQRFSSNFPPILADAHFLELHLFLPPGGILNYSQTDACPQLDHKKG